MMGHKGTIQRDEKEDEVLLKSRLLWLLLVLVMKENVILQSLLG